MASEAAADSEKEIVAAPFHERPRRAANPSYYVLNEFFCA